MARAQEKVTHLIIRIFGALIIGQFWIVWRARSVYDAVARKSLVQAYALVFLLIAAALLRGQLTAGGHFNSWNWANIAMFAGLALFYFYFLLVEPPAVFENRDSVSV